jgi:hypothetical protein
LPSLNLSDEADDSDDIARWLVIVSTWQIFLVILKTDDDIERVGDN